MTGILEEPKIAIGGMAKSGKSVVLFMHKGYDRPGISLDVLCQHAMALDQGEHVFAGSLENPHSKWPICAHVATQ